MHTEQASAGRAPVVDRTVEPFKVTRTGIVIGGHYIPPAARPDRDHELLQAALLDRPRLRDVLSAALERWIAYGMGLIAAGGVVAGLVKQVAA